ncbi:MAG: MoxR family ATPase [Myxococcales bacterium]|nr:MoxR family ATPase [Myxococcales bacterium]MCB9532729.1 MoxR family ATPase [Myxococcales bacterium]
MTDIRGLNELVKQESAFVERLRAEVGKRVVGQRYMIERMLIGLLTGGHVLLEGVPGLAKTLTVNALAQAIHLDFQRIQFTPDLLPADLIGTMIYNQQRHEFEVRKGPVFTNIVLADEINRAPAKVQSALLEAMQELQVTIGDTTHPLPRPFLVLATQNPIEQEGTYPLPEAQVDRFMLMVKVGYPTRDEERRIMDLMASAEPARIEPVIDAAGLARARAAVDQIYIESSVKDYIVDIVCATRDPKSVGATKLADYIEFGASPRASIFLNRAARAHAFLDGRGYVMPEDIKAIAPDVLRHRILPSFEAEADERTSESLLQELLDHIDVP